MLRRFTSNCFARPRIRLHHQLERGGEQERVADLVFLDQAERALRIEAAAVAHDRLAEVQRGQQRVHEPAGPRPVGGRPEEVARLRKAVVRVGEARQVAEQARMRHQRALRRAGGAARVDDERRFVRTRRDRREMRGRGGERRVVVDVARAADARHAEHVREAGQPRRGSARDCRPTADRRRRPSIRSSRAGTRARRARTGTTAAPRPRPSGRSRCARPASRGAAAARARPCRRAARRALPARWTGGSPRAAGPRTCAATWRRSRLPSTARSARDPSPSGRSRHGRC